MAVRGLLRSFCCSNNWNEKRVFRARKPIHRFGPESCLPSRNNPMMFQCWKSSKLLNGLIRWPKLSPADSVLPRASIEWI